MGESITLIDGDVVGDTISGVHDHTGGTTGAAYKERTAWMATYMAGMLKVSNMIWVIFSQLALGLRGASVKNLLIFRNLIKKKEHKLGFGLAKDQVFGLGEFHESANIVRIKEEW
jgi:hypothetical protein